MAKNDRRGIRKSRESFRTREPKLGYYYIVTDTNETEANYIQGFKESLPHEVQMKIVIKVLSKIKTEKLVTTCKEKVAMSSQYAEPWIVFDRDRVVNFDQIIATAKQEGINVGWSNPCIEIWFDAYFGKMHQYLDSVTCCKEFSKTFEKETGQKYKKANNQIYSLLNKHGNEQSAIKEAKSKLTEHNKDGKNKPSEMCPATNIHKLIEEIRKKAEK